MKTGSKPILGKSSEPAHRVHQPGWRYLLGIWAAAFCIRCVYLWQIRNAPFFDLRIGDGEAYHLWARRIAAGDWLGQEVFYQAPLYPYVLAIFHRVLGESAATIRLIQEFVGAISCALLAAAGISLFGRRGALAGICLALYAPAIFLDGQLDKSWLVTLFITALIALIPLATEPLNVRWFGCGILLGLLALTRENALILAIPILFWIVWRPVPPRRRAVGALVFAAGCACVLLPAGLRNLAAGSEFHLTTSQFGPNFYIGNHAGANGTYDALVVGHGNAADEREDASRLAEQASGRKLSPAEISNFWTKRALAYIQSQPVDWLKLTSRKLALTFNTAEVSDTESQDVYAEWSWLLRVLGLFNFGWLLGVAALGAVLTAPLWRRIWFLYAIGGTYALSVAIFYVLARYRFPLVPILMLLAAGGVVKILDHVDLRPTRKLAIAATAATLAIVFANLPLVNTRTSRATNYFGIAAALARDPDRFDQATEFYRRALEVDPRFPAAQFGLGTILARTGRSEEAIPYYRAAVASWPDHEEAHYNLGMALAATGRAQEASQEYNEALRIRPDDAEARIALAKTLIALERPDLAVLHYERSLALQPKNVKALVGLGVALTQLGRPNEAIQKYQLALELDPLDPSAHNSLGWTLANLGRISDAVPHFERALELNPGDENARRNLEGARDMLARRPGK